MFLPIFLSYILKRDIKMTLSAYFSVVIARYSQKSLTFLRKDYYLLY
jgi:hypothetical protein